MIEFDLRKALHTPHGPLPLEAKGAVEPGFTALFGPSGAGKTTLLRMLAGLAQPENGRIVVNGATWFDAAHGIDLPPQRRSIGFVFQDYALFPNLSVRGNIAYAAARAERAWIDELIALTGLGELEDRLPATLSGGQQQRVALARALA
ncbi:ATP-binding cassette domain-containing protein, partial [Oxalobacteraceae bacterium OM1]